VLNGILIVAAIVIVGAFLSVRRARRRDERIHAMHARADNSSGADSFGGFPFFSSDAASGPSHHHHHGDPTGDGPRRPMAARRAAAAPVARSTVDPTGAVPMPAVAATAAGATAVGEAGTNASVLLFGVLGAFVRRQSAVRSPQSASLQH